MDQIIRHPKFPVSVPIKADEGDAIVRADFIVYYCEAAKESLCYFKEARVRVPVKVIKGTGSHKVSATYKLLVDIQILVNEPGEIQRWS
jgi:hypothetical protein